VLKRVLNGHPLINKKAFLMDYVSSRQQEKSKQQTGRLRVLFCELRTAKRVTYGCIRFTRTFLLDKDIFFFR
jgi:hypothetical protein